MQLENKKYKIIGPNGYGKSSWIHNYINQSNRDDISYIAQSDTLYHNLTVQDNAMLILDNDEHFKFIELLKELSCFQMDTKLINLSGGQQRKVEIAMCLAKNAKLYILDEPLNNLDKSAVRIVANKIALMDKPVIFVDHLDIIAYDEILNIPKVKKRTKLSFSLNLKILMAEIKNNKLLINLIIIMFLIISLIFTMYFSKHGAIDYSKYNYQISGNDVNAVDTISCNYIEEPEFGIIPIVESEDIPIAYQTFKDDNVLLNGLKRYSFPFTLKNEYGYTVIESSVSRAYFNDLVNNNHILGVYKLQTGQWPEDNSNEVAITFQMAKQLSRLDQYNDSNLIGEKLKFENQEYIISGIYINEVHSPQKVITSYKTNTNVNDKCYIVPNEGHTNLLIELKDLTENLLIIIIINSLVLILIYKLLGDNLKRQIIGFRNHQLLNWFTLIILITYILSNIIYYNTPV